MLRQIQELVRQEPRRIHMKTSIARSNLPPCGTVGCIAGFAVMIEQKAFDKQNPYKVMFEERKDILVWRDKIVLTEEIMWDQEYSHEMDWGRIQYDAERILGISKLSSNYLFVAASWPLDLREKLAAAQPGTSKYAEIVCERIDRYIKVYEDSHKESTVV